MNEADQLKELMFLENKYEETKKKMNNQKQKGELTELHLEELCNLMNIIAMRYSKQGNHATGIQWLRRAIKYSDLIPKAKIITFNNLACIYREEGSLGLALLYITKAQKQADQLTLISDYDGIKFKQDLKVLTDCSLNLCAILSSMKEHYKALRSVRKGISLLEKSKSSKNIPHSYFLSLYPIMKYNEGVELEQLKMFIEARESYQEALRNCDPESQICQKIKKALEFINSIDHCRKNSFDRNSRSILKFKQKQFISLENRASPTPDLMSGKPYIEIKIGSSRKKSSFRNEQNYRTVSYLQQNGKVSKISYGSKKKLKNKIKFQPKVLQENNS